MQPSFVSDFLPTMGPTRAWIRRRLNFMARLGLLSTVAVVSAFPPAAHASKDASQHPTVTVVSTNASGLYLHVVLPRARFATQHAGGRTFVAIGEGAMPTTGLGSIGAPQLPVSGTTVALPLGTCRPSVTVTHETRYTRTHILLWPAQRQGAASESRASESRASESRPTDDPYPVPPFTIDDAAYQVGLPLPRRLAVVGQVERSRGLSLTDVAFYGASYVPPAERSPWSPPSTSA